MGFGASGHREHFAVVQGDFLSSLETVIVVPLDEHASFYDENPLVVLPSFKAFLSRLEDRCVEAPVVTELSAVGSYGLVA